MESPVQKWYENRSVLITGATGFMGKVLLEKMLRDLPGLSKMYIVVRPKRGFTPEQRLETIKKLTIFEALLKSKPEVFDKLVVVEGNLSEESLGFSEANLKKICDEVSVVFHLAASLRLEAGLKDAIIANTLGTQRILEMCKRMKNLDNFIHLSTAFCHCDVENLEEKVYKPSHDPYEIIKMVQTESDYDLNRKMESLIAPHPNSYTFSKRLAEWVVYDYRNEFPVLILRPSIVCPALSEPIPGWVDSLNGPIGILVAGGKGVLRSMLCNEHYTTESIPVDIAINALICAPVQKCDLSSDNIAVLNVTTPHEIVKMTYGELLNRGKEIVYEYPFEWMLWYPDGKTRTNVFIHWLVLIFYQFLPALLLDGIFFLIRKERFMIRVQKKILVGLDMLQYFTLRQWIFDTTNFKKLYFGLNLVDKNIFQLHNSEVDVHQYLVNAILGARKFCMKESMDTLPITRIHLKFLYVLNMIGKLCLYYFLAWLVLSLFGHSEKLSLSYWTSEHLEHLKMT